MDIAASSQEASQFFLFDLPLELLEHICLYLDYRSISILARTHPSLRNAIRPRLPLIRIKHYKELVGRANKHRYACWHCLEVFESYNAWDLAIYYTSDIYGSVAYRVCPKHRGWRCTRDLERGYETPPLPPRTRDRLYTISFCRILKNFMSPRYRPPADANTTNVLLDTMLFVYSLPTFAVAVALSVKEHLGDSQTSKLTIIAVRNVLIEADCFADSDSLPCASLPCYAISFFR